MHEKDKINEIREKLKLLAPRAAKKIKMKSGDQSFTINKQEMTLCLKDEHNRYYHDNMLMYVAIHELAHVLCDEIGHTEKFYAINDILLDRAHELNIYDKNIAIIDNYCQHNS